MMWFQRHEEPKAITDEYEQVSLRNIFIRTSLGAFLFYLKGVGMQIALRERCVGRLAVDRKAATGVFHSALLIVAL